MSDKVYNVLKYLAIICLPALEEFVKRVLPIWNIPYASEIAETLNAIAVLVGALICVSVISYNNAKIKAEVDLDSYKDVNEK